MRLGVLVALLVMIAIAVAPDLSGRHLERDLESATPRTITRALRHLDGERRLDSDDRLITLLAHEDRRTRERILRHISRLNSSNTPVAILDAVKAGLIDLEDGIEAIERIRNPLSRAHLDAWLTTHDEDGSIREALKEHLARLAAEEDRWGAPAHVRAVIEAQVSALGEGTP